MVILMNHAQLRVFLLLLSGMAQVARAADEPGVEFFEKRIRPVLIENCYECHNSQDKTEGGLALDDRDGLREGGDSGPAIVPGKPDASLLMQGDPPRKGQATDAQGRPEALGRGRRRLCPVDRASARPDPRDQPPAAEELRAAHLVGGSPRPAEAVVEFSAARAGRPPPEVRREDWSEHPIDRFVLARLEQAGLEPGPLRPTAGRSFAG